MSELKRMVELAEARRGKRASDWADVVDMEYYAQKAFALEQQLAEKVRDLSIAEEIVIGLEKELETKTEQLAEKDKEIEQSGARRGMERSGPHQGQSTN